jgi:hypothetical protein
VGGVIEEQLFWRLVRECGLSPLFAEQSMRRVCQKMGVDDPEALTDEQLQRAMPRVRDALGVFLDPADLDPAMRRIRALLDHI